MPVGYGKKIRKAVSDSKRKSQQRYECPSCSRNSVRRNSNGIWTCRKCNAVFASGAYEFGR